MKTITVEELEKIEWNQSMVVDIRPNDQYQRGTFPGAVNIPMAELEERRKELDEAKTIYMLCHTGDRSQEYVEELEDEGYDAVNVEGGYRAYLRLSLSRFMQGDCQKKRGEKRRDRAKHH